MSIQENECLLIKRKSDGEIFRHSTLVAGQFPPEKYSMMTEVYDTDGYLKQRWWQVPLSEETKAAEKARAAVIEGLNITDVGAGS